MNFNDIQSKNKNIKINNIIKDVSNPPKIKLLDNLGKEPYTFSFSDNVFCVFKSINDIIYLIYTNCNISIISYDIISNKIINEIKNAHNNYILNLRYYFDKSNNRDLILSLSIYDNNLKLWNINNLKCILNLINVYQNGFLYSACFLNDNNNIYILVSNNNYQNSELIKVYDINGNKIKEINDSKDDTNFIDSYYDNKLSKNYIVTANYGIIKSFDYKQNKIYHIYSDDNDCEHYSIIINDKKGLINMIGSSDNGIVRIWNFHSAELINKIYVNYDELYSICLWNDEYIFAACSDNNIKLIDINKGVTVKDDYVGHNNCVLMVKKINHPIYGECLISQGFAGDGIKLWINES